MSSRDRGARSEVRLGMRGSFHRYRPWALATALLFATAIQAAEVPRVYAIHNGTVVPRPGETIEDGVVLIRDGLIEAVGSGLTVPADAIEVDAKGGWIYPGLIEPWSDLGLSADSPSASSRRGGEGGSARGNRETGAVHPVAKIRPERRAIERLTAFDDDDARDSLERMRKLGYTVVSSAPTSGLLRGTSVVFLLAEDRPVAEIVLRAEAVAHAALERGRFGQGYPGSLMGAAAALRQAFHDASRYETWSRRYEADPTGLRRPERHDAFESLGPLLRGDRRLFWKVDSPHDALLAHSIGEEFGLDVVLGAAGHEWEKAEAIAATGRSLVLPLAYPDKPKVDDDDRALGISRRTLRRWVEAPAGPSKLHEAGIRFAFTTAGLDNRSDAPDHLREAIEAGLPEETALAALTTVPARMLGIERMTGSLDAGKIANVILSTGPLFEEDSQLTEVIVDGRRYPIEIKEKPQGDPNAVVDPRGSWSVTIDFGGRTVERNWTIEGDEGRYSGTAETGRGDVDFESIELEGNRMTVRLPGRSGGSFEVVVIVEGDSFEGEAEMGSRTATVKGSRESGPGGDGR